MPDMAFCSSESTGKRGNLRGRWGGGRIFRGIRQPSWTTQLWRQAVALCNHFRCVFNSFRWGGGGK